jgi:hypothetical protein
MGEFGLIDLRQLVDQALVFLQLGPEPGELVF